MSKIASILILLVGFLSAGITQPYVISRIAPLPNADETYVNDINARGQMVGFCRFKGQPSRGFLLDDGVVTEIRVAGADTSALAINDSGTVVGVWTDAFDATHAFEWTPATGIRGLFPSRMATRPADINNHGD